MESGCWTEGVFAHRGVGRRTMIPPVGACDFLNLDCILWLESFKEHLPTIIAGVLRLRAIGRPLCDRSAWRFAQDDGFVGLKNFRLVA
jgi:hypothetical protein